MIAESKYLSLWLNDLIIFQLVDMNFAPGHRFAGYGYAQHISEVRGFGRDSFDDLVTAANQVFLGDADIGKAAVHDSADYLEAFEAGRQILLKIMFKLGVKQMIDSIDIMFILENSRKIPDY